MDQEHNDPLPEVEQKMACATSCPFGIPILRCVKRKTRPLIADETRMSSSNTIVPERLNA
jgi:hypothetical protein